MATTWSGVVTGLVFGGLQGAVVMGLFGAWRHKPEYRHIYQPAAAKRPDRAVGEPKGPWYKEALKVGDKELLHCVGLDSYMLVRFLHMCFKLCLVGVVLAVGILVPVYYTNKFDTTEVIKEDTNLDKITLPTGYLRPTIARLNASSDRLWASAGVFTIFILFFLKLIHDEWKNFLPLRLDYIVDGDADSGPEYRNSILVEELPMDLRTDAALETHFNQKYPGTVVGARVTQHTEEVDVRTEARTKSMILYENAVAARHAKPEKEAKFKVGGVLCCGGKKVPAEPHHQAEMERLTKEAYEELEKVKQLPKEKASCNTGYVTFNTPQGKMDALRDRSRSDMSGSLLKFPAPAPKDIIWKNMTMDRSKTKMIACGWCVFWSIGMLLWVIPVTFVQSIANLEATYELIGLGDKEDFPIDTGSAAYGIIAGLLPVIFLAILMAVVPMLIYWSSTQSQKVKARSTADTYTLKWHFGYQIANLWLIVLSGSLISQLSPMISDPGSIPKTIAIAIPGASQFFMISAILAALAGLSMEISGAVKVIVFRLLNKILGSDSKSDRTLEASRNPPAFKWGWLYPPMIFQLMVAFFYIYITPIMLVPLVVYFGYAWLVYKYQALFVYVQESEGGGAYFFLLSKIMMGVAYMGELVFIAYMNIKEAPEQSTLGIILLVATICTHCHVGRKYINAADRTATIAARVEETMRNRQPENLTTDSLKVYTQEALRPEIWNEAPRGYREEAFVEGLDKAVV